MAQLIDPTTRKFVTPRSRFESLLKVGVDRLNTDQWSNVVDAWNGLMRIDRETFAAECRQHGHMIAKTPVGPMCRRCVMYF